MFQSSFCLVIILLHILTVQHYVQSAETMTKLVNDLLESGNYTVDCKDSIKESILSKTSDQWCGILKSNDMKNFMIENSCYEESYDKLTQAACSKPETPDITTSSRPTSESPSAKTNQTLSLHSTVTTKITDGFVTQPMHSSITNTNTVEDDTTESNAPATTTSRHGVTNTNKNTQVRATRRPCVFCGSSQNSPMGWLLMIVVVALVKLSS